MTQSGLSRSVTSPAPRRSVLPVSRSVGAGAGLLTLSFLVFAAVGAVWGLLRPAYTGTVTEQGAVSLDGAFNVEFTAFISYVVATGLLGVGVSLTLFLQSPATRGPGMLWWLILVMAVSSLVFFEAGQLSSALLHPLPDPDTLEQGSRISLVPGFSPGIGLVAAPFMAGLTYWFAALVTPEEEPDDFPLQ